MAALLEAAKDEVGKNTDGKLPAGMYT
jgi:hypothetical protein